MEETREPKPQQKRRPSSPRMAERFGAVLDRLVFAVSPERGARRMALRRMWEQAERYRDRSDEERFATYEGAESERTRGSKWLGSRLSPDSALEDDLESLRERSRELFRNDSLGGAVDSRVNLVVGCGFKPQARIADQPTLNRALEALYKRWSQMAGRSGESLWQLQRLADRHFSVDGESFTILSDVGRADKPVPLTVEVIDPSRVETPPHKAGDKHVRMGIERDESGQIVAYWVRRTHPYDTVDLDMRYERIEAARVLHLIDRWFAGQSRGLPWLCRALNRIRDAKDLDEAEIIAAQVSACYAAFVTSPMGAQRAAIGAGKETNSAGQRLQNIAPGTIRYLNAGEEVSFGNPQRPGATFEPFQKWNYRRIAAAMNWPYEMVVKDWGGLSFAAGRLSLTDARQDVRCRQQLHKEQWLTPIWHRFVDEVVIVGEVPIDPRAYARAPWKFREHAWIAPAWPYALNPGEETDAKAKRVNENQMSQADAVAEDGYDLDELYEQRAYERGRERELAIEPRPVNGGPAPGPGGPDQATRGPGDKATEEAEEPELEGAAA